LFTQWVANEDGTQFMGVGKSIPSVEGGLYRAFLGPRSTPMLSRETLRSDTLYHFEHGPMSKVLLEISRFWESASKYERLGMPHKRGILLYGPPGNGKTAIVRHLMAQTVERGGLAIEVQDLHEFQYVFPKMREIEKGRPTLVLMEDLENYCHQEKVLLELMDGSTTIGDGVLFLGTTNYLDQIPPRIRCRPSRIDTLIEIGAPCLAQRLEYLQYVMQHTFKPGVDLGWGIDRLESLASKTEGFSLAALKEVLISIIVYEVPQEETLERLKALANTELGDSDGPKNEDEEDTDEDW
jgi:SpoVK/Ycf46/Vps4 family AAA+-type ATPase